MSSIYIYIKKFDAKTLAEIGLIQVTWCKKKKKKKKNKKKKARGDRKNEKKINIDLINQLLVYKRCYPDIY